MSTEKKYVGKAKKVSTKFGEIINASFKLEDLKAIVNDKGYVNVSISEMKQADKYGYTHTAYWNDYQPKAQAQVTNADDDLNSLPF
jgi:hypothetical protein